MAPKVHKGCFEMLCLGDRHEPTKYFFRKPLRCLRKMFGIVIFSKVSRHKCSGTENSTNIKNLTDIGTIFFSFTYKLAQERSLFSSIVLN